MEVQHALCMLGFGVPMQRRAIPMLVLSALAYLHSRAPGTNLHDVHELHYCKMLAEPYIKCVELQGCDLHFKGSSLRSCAHCRHDCLDCDQSFCAVSWLGCS